MEAVDVEAGGVEAVDVEMWRCGRCGDVVDVEMCRCGDVEAVDVEAGGVEAVDVEAGGVEAVDVEIWRLEMWRCGGVEAADVEAVDVEAAPTPCSMVGGLDANNQKWLEPQLFITQVSTNQNAPGGSYQSGRQWYSGREVV